MDWIDKNIWPLFYFLNWFCSDAIKTLTCAQTDEIKKIMHVIERSWHKRLNVYKFKRGSTVLKIPNTNFIFKYAIIFFNVA